MKLKHTPGPWVKDYHGTIGHIKTLCNPLFAKLIEKATGMSIEEVVNGNNNNN